MSEDSNCPYCGALPCDWTDNPHKKEYTLLMVIADIRAALGVGDKPMLNELSGLIKALVHRQQDLEKSLKFYRDGFKLHPKRSKFGIDLSTWEPTAELLDDCGEMARASLGRKG